MKARSYLYVPGDAPEKVAKIGRWGADAVIIDLEDAVAPANKERARHETAAALASGVDAPEVWVRVNSGSLDTDIAAVAGPGLTGIVVPKAEPPRLTEADAALTAAEKRLGRPAGTFPVLALVETSAGVLDVRAVAQSPRVVRLSLGEADLIGELGLRPGPERSELTSIRLQIVLASAAAGLAPPVGPVETDLSPDADLVKSTKALLALGFRARTAIHPRQVAAINAVFTPTTEEIRAARRVVNALGTDGVVVGDNNRMIDAAVVRSAREVLARAVPGPLSGEL